MKYNLLIIKSDDVYDYFDNSADGIEYTGLTYNEMNTLASLSLKQGFSIVIQNHKEE